MIQSLTHHTPTHLTPSPLRSTYLGCAVRLHHHPNPNARLSYHTITNKAIYFIAQFWKDNNDPARGTREQEINYLILLHFAERDSLASLEYSESKLNHI